MLREDNQSDVIEAFNSTSRYVDDLLNMENNFFESMALAQLQSGWVLMLPFFAILPVMAAYKRAVLNF